MKIPFTASRVRLRCGLLADVRGAPESAGDTHFCTLGLDAHENLQSWTNRGHWLDTGEDHPMDIVAVIGPSMNFLKTQPPTDNTGATYDL
jgi:hypothetical protein